MDACGGPLLSEMTLREMIEAANIDEVKHCGSLHKNHSTWLAQTHFRAALYSAMYLLL